VSALYRLRVLDISVAWFVVLALNALAAGCGADGLREFGGGTNILMQADGTEGADPTRTLTVFDADLRRLPIP
jgi:hypothetical protein